MRKGTSWHEITFSGNAWQKKIVSLLGHVLIQTYLSFHKTNMGAHWPNG